MNLQNAALACDSEGVAAVLVRSDVGLAVHHHVHLARQPIIIAATLKWSSRLAVML